MSKRPLIVKKKETLTISKKMVRWLKKGEEWKLGDLYIWDDNRITKSIPLTVRAGQRFFAPCDYPKRNEFGAKSGYARIVEKGTS